MKTVRLLIAAVLLAACSAVQAAPFAVSDAWPLTNPDGSPATLPDTCAGKEGSGAPFAIALRAQAGSMAVNNDMAGTSPGAHTWSVTCTNSLWGLSSTPVDWTFVAGAPPAPANVRLIAPGLIVSDPWTSVQQPDTCTSVEGVGSPSKPLTLVTTNGQKALRHDARGSSTGTHNLAITCANVWGQSSTVNFQYAAGAPAGPASLRLAP